MSESESESGSSESFEEDQSLIIKEMNEEEESQNSVSANQAVNK